LASYREVWANNQPIGLVSVNVDTAKAAVMLGEVVPNTAGCTFIMDERLNIIRQSDTALIDWLVPRIPAGAGNGFFDLSYQGKEIFVSYYTSPYSGFTFVAASPLDQIQSSAPMMKRLMLLFLLFQGLMIIVTLFLARHYFWTPVRTLFAGMRQVREGNFSARLPENPTYEFGYINRNFNAMADNIEKLIEENYASKLVSQEIRLKNIQDQLNEHFLYNTLDSIHWLARRENASQASQMVLALANFYRISLSAGHDIIPVRSVSEMIRNYLFIQQIRLRDSLSYTITCDPSLEEVLMPKGLLQPLVENALVHGLKALPRPGEIRVSFDRLDTIMRISVADNGRGFSEERLLQVRTLLESSDAQGEGSFALKTVQSQLRLYYGVKNSVRIESASGKGAAVCFEVPLTGGAGND
jgi:two-component system sensor histidine kinase YesM